MKKLLILTYDFPPYVSVGALRPYAWYKYLKEYGIEPIVITRQWGNKYGNHLDYIAPGDSKKTIIEQTEQGTIIRTPYKPNLANRIMLRYGDQKYSLLRKLISAYYETMQWFFTIGPKSGIYRAAKSYLQHHSVDCIIATGEPFVLFKYASKLSRIFNVPWIADYRDPWIQDQAIKKSIFYISFYSIVERRYLKSCNLIITVSSFIEKQISTNLNNKKFALLLNGFDEEITNKIINTPQNSNIFTMALAGSILKYHPIESFLEALKTFLQRKNNEILFNLYGINIENELKELIEKKYPEIKENVVFYKKLSNTILLAELVKSNVFLLFNYYSIMGTKIFDYIALKRKILLCYENDLEAERLKKLHFHIQEFEGISKHLQADLIRETNSGIIVKNQEHLLHVLEELYQEFQTNGKIACHSHGIEKYSRKKQTQILANLINELIEGN